MLSLFRTPLWTCVTKPFGVGECRCRGCCVRTYVMRASHWREQVCLYDVRQPSSDGRKSSCKEDGVGNRCTDHVIIWRNPSKQTKPKQCRVNQSILLAHIITSVNRRIRYERVHGYEECNGSRGNFPIRTTNKARVARPPKLLHRRRGVGCWGVV